MLYNYDMSQEESLFSITPDTDSLFRVHPGVEFEILGETAARSLLAGTPPETMSPAELAAAEHHIMMLGADVDFDRSIGLDPYGHPPIDGDPEMRRLAEKFRTERGSDSIL